MTQGVVAGSTVGSATVAEMLADFRLLARFLLHIGRHGGSQSTSGARAMAGEADPGIGRLVDFADLLVASPEIIANDPVQLRRLYSALVLANTLAAPATVVSVRLTYAFEGAEAGTHESTQDDRRIAAFLRWQARCVAVFGVSLLLITTVLIAHVSTGKQIIRQLDSISSEWTSITAEIASFRNGSGRAGTDTSSLACANSLGLMNAVVEGNTAQQLCARLQEVALRKRIVVRELALWNHGNERMRYIFPILLDDRTIPLLDVSETEWETTPLRTSALLTLLTGTVLPPLLGTLGSCTYVYRRLTNQIHSFTLERAEGLQVILRIILGSILGGLLGVIWTDGRPIHLEGMDLSLTALAFFVGFAVETVFTIIDRTIAAVGTRVRPPHA